MLVKKTTNVAGVHKLSSDGANGALDTSLVPIRQSKETSNDLNSDAAQLRLTRSILAIASLIARQVADETNPDESLE